MSTILGCIADDFTGATDLAGLLARFGVPVSLRIGIPTEPPQKTAAFEVIALKSRTAPVAEAVEETLAALAWLKQAGAQRYFWKYCSTFDSTPEGNIGPVAEALMQALGTDQTIYCPAFPENGRSIFMGNLFVGEQPLAESPMKNHPLTPMTDSNLMRLLAPQTEKPVGLVNRLTVAKGPDALKERMAALRAEGVSHVVVDAVSNDDLTTIATACQDMPLMTGGSAIAMPLPKLYQDAGLLPVEAKAATPPKLAKKAVILSGSCSTMTRAQVQAYIATGAPCLQLDALDLSAKGPAAALDWLSQQDLEQAPLLYASAEPEKVKQVQDKLGVTEAGELVERTLAECAVFAREHGARRFVVAGGETSGAVTKALGTERLIIGAEIAPGVPWTFCTSAQQDIALTLKSGNFGDVDFFATALNRLEES